MKPLEQYDELNLSSFIQEADTVSFDLFDTLITRLAASPSAVQYYVGYLLTVQEPSLTGFFDIRKQAEEAARIRHSSQSGDVDLDMIYSEFCLTENWTSDAIALAKRLEQEIESRFVLPRFDITKLAEYAKAMNKRVILVSDTYFSRRFVETMLRTLMLDGLFDEIYLSSEQKARKDTGALWQLVVNKESGQGKRLMHVGDNPHSDGVMAQVHGVHCVHVDDPLSLASKRGFRCAANRDWRTDILMGPLVARYGNGPIATLSKSHPSEVTDESDLGYLVYGPILLAFFGWLTENPALRRIKRLYFVAREGYFLKKLYDRLCERFSFTGLPPSNYLPMSRRAVNTASQAILFDPTRAIDGGGFSGTVEEFLRARFGLELRWAHRFAFPVSLPTDREYLATLLNILRSEIVWQARREAEAMLYYCKQAGMLDDAQLGLIDAGYSGTIQTGLQMILNRPLIGFYMVTSPRAERVRATGGLAFGCFQDALYGEMRPDGFMHKTVPLEGLLTAPHGQLERFDYDASGCISPIYLPSGLSQRNFPALEKIFEGALSYCIDSIRSGGREILGAIVPARDKAFCALDALFAGELRVSKRISGYLYLEDNFSGKGEIPCLPPSAISQNRPMSIT